MNIKKNSKYDALTITCSNKTNFKKKKKKGGKPLICKIKNLKIQPNE